MALRVLLSNRIIIPQRISLIRFCRYYTPLTFDHRSINSSSSIPHSSLYCHQLKTNSQLLSTQPTYFLSYKFASSSSDDNNSNNNSPSSPSSPSDGNSSSSSSSFSSSNDGKSSNNNNDGGNDSADATVPVVIQPGNPLMSVEVPENYPIVPLIPVTRHPLFPKFIKMLEITNKDLVELIRRKVKLNQPYAGIFLRKETSPSSTETTTTTGEKSSTTTATTETPKDKEKEKLSNTVTSDVIKNLDEVYKIGAFVQIHEVHDMGDRLRMIVMAHRRIKIVGIASDDLAIEDVDRRRPPQKTNGSRRRQKRKDEPVIAEEVPSESTPTPSSSTTDEPIVVNKILLVNTENVAHDEYEQTPELKVKEISFSSKD